MKRADGGVLGNEVGTADVPVAVARYLLLSVRHRSFRGYRVTSRGARRRHCGIGILCLESYSCRTPPLVSGTGVGVVVVEYTPNTTGNLT